MAILQPAVPVPGQGVRARVDGFEVIVDSGRIMKNNGVNIIEGPEKKLKLICRVKS